MGFSVVSVRLYGWLVNTKLAKKHIESVKNEVTDFEYMNDFYEFKLENGDSYYIIPQEDDTEDNMYISLVKPYMKISGGRGVGGTFYDEVYGRVRSEKCKESDFKSYDLVKKIAKDLITKDPSDVKENYYDSDDSDGSNYKGRYEENASVHDFSLLT